MMRIAYGDIVRSQPVETVVRQISYLADAIVEAALDYTCRHMEEQLRPATPRDVERQPLRRARPRQARRPRAQLLQRHRPRLSLRSKMARPMPAASSAIRSISSASAKELVRLLTETTDFGSAYRVDLRLRPDGSHGADLPELRQHALVLRRQRPHLGAAGVRQSPAHRRRPRPRPRLTHSPRAVDLSQIPEPHRYHRH